MTARESDERLGYPVTAAGPSAMDIDWGSQDYIPVRWDGLSPPEPLSFDNSRWTRMLIPRT